MLQLTEVSLQGFSLDSVQGGPVCRFTEASGFLSYDTVSSWLPTFRWNVSPVFILFISNMIIHFASNSGSLKQLHTSQWNDWKVNTDESKPSEAKQSRYTPWWRLGERRYSSYSFLTSALDGRKWSASRSGRSLAPGKGIPVPIVQEAGWAPEPVWTQRIEEESFVLAGDRTPIARLSSP
jgi:hypothetical protein